MTELLTVRYGQTGQSTAQNSMGMREMQARAYAARNAQYLLLKAPPASGKSRALMFLALDKVLNQGLQKAIVAVPEISIGGSFADTNLIKFGFFADWHVDAGYNLCTFGNEGKVDKLIEFLNNPKGRYLLCTHATLRFAYERLNDPHKFDNTLIAIDEFHHTSAEEGNKLGAIVDGLIHNSSAHIVAMTGSYFRGDQVPILTSEAEALFTQVTYTYYEQLNGYKHLKSLGLGYHFYQGRYLEAMKEVLDLDKKTIVHIPNVNSAESTGQKYSEVDSVLDAIGEVMEKDPKTGIMTLKTSAGKLLKVADLVTDDPMRVNVLAYLRDIKQRDQMDIIIALGMAKEGFDWPWCEHVLTIGYRSSLTEVVQIIGRATRDCEGKSHAQFTNLIAQPDAEDEDVKNSVNNMLKAITLSLLMREVLAPNITFRPRSLLREGETLQPGEIVIDDLALPISPRVHEILNSGGIEQIVTTLMNTPEAVNPVIAKPDEHKILTEVAMPKIITQLFPDLPPEDISLLNDLAQTQMVITANGGLVTELPPDAQVVQGDSQAEGEDAPANSAGAQAFLRVGEKFINVSSLNIDLIESINPFQGAYEILSKSVTAPMLKTIQDQVTAQRTSVSEEEAVLLWPRIKDFKRQFGVEPSLNATDAYERRLAEVLAYVRNKKAQQMQAAQAPAAE
ncbi:ATP-dependent helicase [Desulfovibrio sp. OttesenSCG-928-A18]|nr:ATP-dependent helicase [Desulfovibrio sp. OttesenSCG-928-A18]